MESESDSDDDDNMDHTAPYAQWRSMIIKAPLQFTFTSRDELGYVFAVVANRGPRRGILCVARSFLIAASRILNNYKDVDEHEVCIWCLKIGKTYEPENIDAQEDVIFFKEDLVSPTVLRRRPGPDIDDRVTLFYQDFNEINIIKSLAGDNHVAPYEGCKVAVFDPALA